MWHFLQAKMPYLAGISAKYGIPSSEVLCNSLYSKVLEVWHAVCCIACMDWMEEIRARLTDAARDSVLAELGQGLREVPAHLVEVRVYAHAWVPTDLCIHLHWRGTEPPAGGSEAGLRLAAGLQAVGSVRHSIWRRKE